MSDPVNDDNVKAFRELQKTIAERTPLMLIGAGVSARCKYPTWEGLLKEFHERAAGVISWQANDERILVNLDDILWRAEEYRLALKQDPYEALIEKTFAPEGHPLDPLVRALVRLKGFSHILTTNFDTLIERAHEDWDSPTKPTLQAVCWEDNEDLAHFITCLAEKSTKRYLLYLHGRYDRPQSTILSNRDYTQRYIENDSARRKLFAIFATKSVVFIGFSLKDPDLMLMFREVTATLAGAPRHFALMPLNPDSESAFVTRRLLQGKFGVEPVFYPWSKEHTGLVELIDAIQNDDASLLPRIQSQDKAMPLERPPLDPEDPQKGQWGGQSESPDRKLDAKVEADGRSWYSIQLRLTRKTGSPPLQQPVRFHLHDTFSPMVRKPDEITADEAILELGAYGAFTVGCEESGGNTRLELDLSKLPDAPRKFREA